MNLTEVNRRITDLEDRVEVLEGESPSGSVTGPVPLQTATWLLEPQAMSPFPLEPAVGTGSAYYRFTASQEIQISSFGFPSAGQPAGPFTLQLIDRTDDSVLAEGPGVFTEGNPWWHIELLGIQNTFLSPGTEYEIRMEFTGATWAPIQASFGYGDTSPLTRVAAFASADWGGLLDPMWRIGLEAQRGVVLQLPPEHLQEYERRTLTTGAGTPGVRTLREIIIQLARKDDENTRLYSLFIPCDVSDETGIYLQRWQHGNSEAAYPVGPQIPAVGVPGGLRFYFPATWEITYPYVSHLQVIFPTLADVELQLAGLNFVPVTDAKVDIETFFNVWSDTTEEVSEDPNLVSLQYQIAFTLDCDCRTRYYPRAENPDFTPYAGDIPQLARDASNRLQLMFVDEHNTYRKWHFHNHPTKVQTPVEADDATTRQFVEQAIQAAALPVGMVMLWVGTTGAPAGFLLCDGATHDTADHPELSYLRNNAWLETFTTPDLSAAAPAGLVYVVKATP